MGIDSEITDDKIILSFNGIADSDKIESFLIEAENVLSKGNSEASVQKKVYAILVEFLQNLFHHTEEGLLPDTNTKVAQLYLKQHDSNYFIYSRNFINNSRISTLKSWIDKVNFCSVPELKQLYLETLQHTDFSEKGGASLGMIDIARKTKNTLSYQFTRVNNDVSQFALKASILKAPLNELIIYQTKYTPGIHFNKKKGVLEIKGRSIPEDTFNFYNPVMTWLDNYVYQAAESTCLVIFLEFFNTGSSKYIFEIIKRLKKIDAWENKAVMVKWYYEKGDEDMYETGIDYKDICTLDFEIIEK